jgi:pyridinium-3,5-bisthiocarboxylic acid mononucleotide nickel chelatase
VAEPTAAYLDCTAGVAGDMLLGALLDAGAELAAVRAAVRSLRIPGLDVGVEEARRCGLACAQAIVSAPAAPQPTRVLADVLALIEAAELPSTASRMAADTFRVLAGAEAAVHGIPVDSVHFHEVGAADALADVVGTATAAEQLGLLTGDASVTCSALAAGSGTARSAHGTIPLPAPAVLQIAAAHGLSLTGGELPGERTTPTGAALVAVLATPGPLPPMTIDAVGSGAGQRDSPERPNLTRLILGQRTDHGPVPNPAQAVTVVETTVDDLEPELWPAVLRAVRAAGAWDCWTTATIGRHGRPGQVLTALCTEQIRPAVVDALFRHTTTLGVRWTSWQRATLSRVTVQVPVGPPGHEHQITVKVAAGPGGHQTAKPELADAERIAQELGWPVRRVCEAARAAYAAREWQTVL